MESFKSVEGKYLSKNQLLTFRNHTKTSARVALDKRPIIFKVKFSLYTMWLQFPVD